MDPNAVLEMAPLDYTASKDDLLHYQQVNGSIMYAMLGTRPDLALKISTLSKYCWNPTPKHAQAAQRALQYLQKTLYTGITYRG